MRIGKSNADQVMASKMASTCQKYVKHLPLELGIKKLTTILGGQKRRRSSGSSPKKRPRLNSHCDRDSPIVIETDSDTDSDPGCAPVYRENVLLFRIGSLYLKHF